MISIAMYNIAGMPCHNHASHASGCPKNIDLLGNGLGVRLQLVNQSVRLHQVLNPRLCSHGDPWICWGFNPQNAIKWWYNGDINIYKPTKNDTLSDIDMAAIEKAMNMGGHNTLFKEKYITQR